MRILSIFYLRLFAISSLCATGHYQESLYPAWRQTFEITQMIHQEKTDIWDVAIFENPAFGRVLAIDGTIQTTERDEFVYHEMLVHPALIAHGKASQVLIIGGGDGGALREVLRHKDVEKVVLVEIDRAIIDLTKLYMPTLSNGAFEDPRVEVVIQDAAVYLKETEKMFDVILCDSCDPIGACSVLFTKEFYGDCKNHLNVGGIFINQNGVPFMQKEEFHSSIKNRKAHFQNVTFYVAPVPTYAGGFMAFGWASDAKYNIPLNTVKKRLEKVSGKMKYYTPAIQKGAFALPAFMLLQKKPSNK
jgi:spermidine synthase